MSKTLLSAILFLFILPSFGQDSTLQICGFQEGNLPDITYQFASKITHPDYRKVNQAQPLQVNIGLVIDSHMARSFDFDERRITIYLNRSFYPISQKLVEASNIQIAIKGLVIPKREGNGILNSNASAIDNLNSLLQNYSNKDLDSLGWDIVMGIGFTINGSYSGVALGRHSYSLASTQVIAHELGHNLGSPHTHSCLWDNGKPLSICVPTEGDCYEGALENSGEGTIMSYCANNFKYHPKVGQLMREYAEFIQLSPLSKPDTPTPVVDKTGISYRVEPAPTLELHTFTYQVSKKDDFSEILHEENANQYQYDASWNVGGETLYFRMKSSNAAGDSPWSGTQKIEFDAPKEIIPIYHDKSFINVDKKETISFGQIDGIDSYKIRVRNWVEDSFFRDYKLSEPNFNSFFFRQFRQPVGGRIYQPKDVQFQVVGYKNEIPVVASEIKYFPVEASEDVLERVIPKIVKQPNLSIPYPYGYLKIGLKLFQGESKVLEKIYSYASEFTLPNLQPNKEYRLVFTHYSSLDEEKVIYETDYSFQTDNFEEVATISVKPIEIRYVNAIMRFGGKGDILYRSFQDKGFKKENFEGKSESLSRVNFKNKISLNSVIQGNSRGNLVAFTPINKQVYQNGFNSNVYTITELDPTDYKVITEFEINNTNYFQSQHIDAEEMKFFVSNSILYERVGNNLKQIWQLFGNRSYRNVKWSKNQIVTQVGSYNNEQFLSIFNKKTKIFTDLYANHHPIFQSFTEIQVDFKTDQIYLFNENTGKLYTRDSEYTAKEIPLSFSDSEQLKFQYAVENKLVFTAYNPVNNQSELLLFDYSSGNLIQRFILSQSTSPVKYHSFYVYEGIIYFSSEFAAYKVFLNCSSPILEVPTLSTTKEVYYKSDESVKANASGCEQYAWKFEDFDTKQTMDFLSNNNSLEIKNSNGGRFQVSCAKDACVSELSESKRVNKYQFEFINNSFFPPSCVEDEFYYPFVLFPLEKNVEYQLEYVLKGETKTLKIPFNGVEAARIPADLPYGKYQISMEAIFDDKKLEVTNPVSVSIGPNVPEFKVSYKPTAFLGEVVPVKIEALKGALYFSLNDTKIFSGKPSFDTTFTMNQMGDFEFKLNYGVLPYCVSNQPPKNFTEVYRISVLALSLDLEDIGLSVYPNPSSKELRMEINKNFSKAQYQLIDIQGRVVKEEKVFSKSLKIDISSLPTGTYFLHTTKDQKVSRHKIVKLAE